MAILAQLASKWLPTQKTSIQVNDDDKSNNLTATVGNFGQMKSQQLKNESGRLMTPQGAGFATEFQMENETFTLAPSASQWSDPDMPYQQVRCNGKV